MARQPAAMFSKVSPLEATRLLFDLQKDKLYEFWIHKHKRGNYNKQ